MTKKKNRFDVNSVVGWVIDMKMCGSTPNEVGIVLETNIRIEGNTYEFVKVLWNTGNVANVPINLIREVKLK